MSAPKRWREMPSGVWLYFKNLPVSTTDESLSAYLRERAKLTNLDPHLEFRHPKPAQEF